MVNAHFIARRLDNTCELLGGKESLKEQGFDKMMNYITIITDLNKSDVNSLVNMLYRLDCMGDIYKDFARHVVYDGVLHDGFYTFNEEFEPDENNLERLFEDMVDSQKEIRDYKQDIENMLKNEESEINNLYKKYQKNIKKDSAEQLKNTEYQKQYEESVGNFNDAFDARVDDFVARNPQIVSWINSNVKELSDADYSMLVSFIHKVRTNER